ncbi:hypothetical protein GOP47_0000554 [Adiantum capillus-veneris]|uniref:Acyl carrier protein n=1 Tax=Adiantum capillus-veneris TaxID=13818 RepID=A0A9D4ZT69_ADICA|nr:hypothetical protein GOP47_0000554 [Adiantum capillus-veneris]
MVSSTLSTSVASTFRAQFLAAGSHGLRSAPFVHVGTPVSRRLRICCEATGVVAKPETVRKVIAIVAKQLATAADKVNAEAKFGDLGADSLDQVEIVMALEEEFDINIEDSGAESILTVQDAANLIEKAAAAKASA